MVVTQLIKAAVAILLFVGLISGGLALSPKAAPKEPEPTSTTSSSDPPGTTSSQTSTSSAPLWPTSATVTLRGNTFENGTLTVAVGATVRWIHDDGTAAHTVTEDNALFDSNPQCVAGVPVSPFCLTEGEGFEFKFTTAGSYAYHCKVHPGMTGTITVA